jgi:predicted anti-sigma-YlaC factor YlaD
MSERTDRPAHGGDSERQHTAGAFDIRTLIALLIGIYGVILLIVGIVNSSDSDLEKSDGVNINLWTGIALIVVAAGFQAWAMLRPVIVPSEQELREQRQRQEREQGQG